MPTKPAAGNKRSKAKNSTKGMDIRVVSDATGGLARHLLTSILTQFGDLDGNPRCHAFCDSKEKVRDSLKGIKRNHSLVFSTLASQALKKTVADLCDARQVPHFDLTGGCVEFIERHTGLKAINDVAAIHKHDSAYFDRIDALEFSLQHDDSRRLESVHEAEIVLVGISRVSKTPTSAYLGWLGYRVANVSLVPGVTVPKELEKCSSKAVGLTMRPRTLAEIRNRRLAINGFKEKLSDSDGYTELRAIIREVMETERMLRELGIPIIDTSDLTIEEIATKVLTLLGRA